MFWDWIACELITLFVIFFHAIISHGHRFSFEVPRIEESRDPDGSPRREEVGRRTLGAYGGFLLPFFYHDRFQLFTTRKRQARNICPNRTPIASGVEEPNSPRRALLLLLSNSPEDEFWKKNMWSFEQQHGEVVESPKKVRKVGKTRSTTVTSTFLVIF